MESQNDDIEEVDIKIDVSIIPLNFIARIIGIRAPEPGEGQNTIIEFELHAQGGFRGRFNIPYTPEIGRLGTAYQANMFLKQIPMDEYVSQRPETRTTPPRLKGKPLGLV